MRRSRKNETSPGRKATFAADERGQSTIEYLVVTFVLVASLIAVPNLYETSSDTLKNKYHSYSFAVAVSDPPRKAFDDEVEHDADKIEKILDIIEEIADLMNNSVFPDLKAGKLPSWEDIKKFGDIIKSLW